MNGSNDKKGLITVLKDGPYMVKNVNDFINSKGKAISSKSTMALCRCGKSSKKPFCDGTHIKVNFDGKKDQNRIPDKVDTYKGKDITIHDNRGVCSHFGYCSDELPSVWGMKKKPWINPDGSSVKKIINICEKCPSGALSYNLPNENRIQNVKGRDEQISISPRRYDADGPYNITGSIELKDPDGAAPESQEHYTLCRCGASKNKPFCSGEHWHVKFIDDDN